VTAHVRTAQLWDRLIASESSTLAMCCWWVVVIHGHRVKDVALSSVAVERLKRADVHRCRHQVVHVAVCGRLAQPTDMAETPLCTSRVALCTHTCAADQGILCRLC
jgi:hypothetical protein